MHTFRLDSRTGGIVLKKNGTPRSFLTKLILLKMSLRVHVLHGIAGYARFGRVHGIRMRISPRNMLEYLSLKSSSGQSGTYHGQQRMMV